MSNKHKTLVDELAIDVMPIVLEAQRLGLYGDNDGVPIAKYAYDIAYAMLKERERDGK